MILTQVIGVNRVLSAIKKRTAAVNARTAVGLKKAGLFLQRESQKICPVDLGVLHNTAFTRQTKGGLSPEVTVGYTAAYAVYVHENLDALHGKAFNAFHAKEIAAGTMHNRGDDQQAKFLERPMREKRAEMAKIVRQEGRIK